MNRRLCERMAGITGQLAQPFTVGPDDTSLLELGLHDAGIYGEPIRNDIHEAPYRRL
jgi:hypothetical protein